ncbi:TfoX/Sxy family protein [Tabrizicola sp.]|uniref:TfoX/Sxy family protein n=1 Tax=Tabrizicola sp. TaxID=2005166 RepID=UPI001A50F16F|nr:TfoX/Sxy family protein [Tabrizicola sp.]MBL9075504.1 TfoX/Sxy family protein [Tabrizicola sp.]
MGSRAESLAPVLDCLSALPLTHRRMMGEYVLYLDGKVVAVIGDDRLWLKPTPGGLAALPDCPREAPFPGAKDWIAADSLLDEPDRLIPALRAIAADLPAPKPKKPRKPKA